jgi:predicted amidohydrolase
MKEAGMILLEVIAAATRNAAQVCSIAHHIADLSFSQFKELYREDEKNQRVSEQN